MEITEGGGVLMTEEKDIVFEEGYRYKMTWFLCISSPDNKVECSAYLTPEEAKKLFDLMKEAGF
jgi:hypothetical protein